LLIYNRKKEFVGIDDEDLKRFGFNNINELLDKSNDFADLFVKKTGYIHNFKSFSWIDFILHSNSDNNKAIINANGHNYECSLQISSFHFSSNESGYLVILKDLCSLEDSSENKNTKSTKDENPTSIDSKLEETPALEISLEDLQTDSKQQEKLQTTDLIKSNKQIKEPLKSDEYKYNPQIAADALGLPVDLVEEFIGDFVEQANKFHDKLYKAPNAEDLSNVKTLSHKLKGVAANLRIEDAYKVLTSVNHSQDKEEILTNLDLFYKIISKYKQKKISQTDNSNSSIDEDDIYKDLLVNPQEKESDLQISDASIYKHHCANKLGITADAANEFIKEFKKQFSLHQEEFENAIENQNIQKINKAATLLKGMSDNLHLNEISEVLKEIQKEDDTNIISKKLAKLKTYIDKL